MKKNNEPGNSEGKFFIERGFGQSIGFGLKPVVLVIDMMNAFTDEKSPLGFKQESQIKVINKILAVARQQKIPIFFTVVIYDEENLSDAGFWFHKQKGLSILRANTKEVNIDQSIERKTDESIIVKKFASAFFGTDLISRFNYKQIDTVIMMGCSTSGCIRATAIDAIQLGLRPIIVKDAINDRSENAHKQSIFDLQAKYADVVKSEKVLAYLKEICVNNL